MRIVEKFVQAKTGNIEDCEDVIFYNEDYVVVVDGVTSKSETKFNDKTAGKLAAETIVKTFEKLERTISCEDALITITRNLSYLYKTYKTKIRFSATAAVYSKFKKELWLIGDSQAILNNKVINNKSNIDRITSEARALFIKSEIEAGKSEEYFRIKDTGREVILPILKCENIFENSDDSYYGYSVLNGIKIPRATIIKNIKVDEIIVMATDGYPVLKETLKESEDNLKEIIESDPICIGVYKSTKGLAKDAVSFDDRAYISFYAN